MTSGPHLNRVYETLERTRELEDKSAERSSSSSSTGVDAAKALWVALMQTLAPRVASWGVGQTSSSPTETQRHVGDRKLTFSAPLVDGSDDQGPLGLGTDAETTDIPERIGRMTLEVDGGRLGTVYLTVQRQGSAVSVVVGVADPVQRALVELELGSLVQALRASGLNVGSVRVMHPDAAGTALAQGKKSMISQSTESASQAYRTHRSRSEDELDEGLNVVG